MLSAAVLLIAAINAVNATLGPSSFESNRLPFGYRTSSEQNRWRLYAMQELWRERILMGHTPLKLFQPPGFPNTDILLKDESKSRTQSVKHRFAWALLSWAISEGKVTKGKTVYDETSGNMGASMSYMCSLVGLKFVAAVANDLEVEKARRIVENGGKLVEVDESEVLGTAKLLAEKNNGFFMNQDGNAQVAEEYHDSGSSALESTNMYYEILKQMAKNKKQIKKVPDYFVHAAGTGGTITSVARFAKRYNLNTTIVLADSEYSLYFDYVIANRFVNKSGYEFWKKPGVEGTGYGLYVEPLRYRSTTSLDRGVIDEAMKMPDIATVASMYVLRNRKIGGGPSAALDFLVALYKAYQLKDRKDIEGRLTIATVIGDPGKNYESTYFNPVWINEKFADRGGMEALNCWKKAIQRSIDTGSDFVKEGLKNCSRGRPKDWYFPEKFYPLRR